jgi:O-antigen/teichoic acid export membrane protein
MLFWGGWILKTMYGSVYAGYGMVVGILALSQLVETVSMPLSGGLYAMERPDVIFKSYLLSLSLMLTAGLWFVFSYGVVGVAIGLLVGNVAGSFFRWIMYWKQLRVYSLLPTDKGWTR